MSDLDEYQLELFLRAVYRDYERADSVQPGVSRARDLVRHLETAQPSGAGMLATVQSLTASVEELTGVKDAAETMMRAAKDDIERSASRILYHLAVAAAFSRHAVTISDEPLQNWLDIYITLDEDLGEDCRAEPVHEVIARLLFG